MSDIQPDLDNLPEDANIAQVRGALDRERELRRAAETDASRATVLERENAMLRAGVDSSHPAFSYFNAGYSGELEAEAIKAEWAKIVPTGATPPLPPPSEEPPPPANDAGGLTPEQAEALRRDRSALNSDTSPPGAEPLKPLGIDIMDAAFEAQNPGGVRARPNAGMNDKSLNAGFSTLFGRAVKDDPEAVFKRPNESWADATDRWRRSQS